MASKQALVFGFSIRFNSRSTIISKKGLTKQLLVVVFAKIIMQKTIYWFKNKDSKINNKQI